MADGDETADGRAAPADFDRMVEELAGRLAAGAAVTDDDRRRAEGHLRALGVDALVEAVRMAERIVVAADGFHPVASFFVHGSPEQAYILDVLRRSR